MPVENRALLTHNFRSIGQFFTRPGTLLHGTQDAIEKRKLFRPSRVNSFKLWLMCCCNFLLSSLSGLSNGILSIFGSSLYAVNLLLSLSLNAISSLISNLLNSVLSSLNGLLGSGLGGLGVTSARYKAHATYNSK